MDEKSMKTWIDLIWKKRPGGLLKNKSLLIFEKFRTHLMDSIFKKLEAENTDTSVIPGGLTSVLQPLDVSLNKPFKDNVRTLWTEWMAGDHSEIEFTKSGRLRKPSITLWCNWIIKAWDK